LIGAFLLAHPNPALANWWIVRASDKKCLVVDIEPTRKDKSITKIGKEVYPTREEAEADVKRLCKQWSSNDQNQELSSGKVLIGCIDCNRWGHPGDDKLIMELMDSDLEALRGSGGNSH
jgi:hypothetical protein